MNSKGGASRSKAGFGDEQNSAQYSVFVSRRTLESVSSRLSSEPPGSSPCACLQRARSPERENSGFSELNLEVK